MTQKDLANAVSCSVDTIRRWEKGVLCPDLNDAQKIREVLGQDKEYLLS